VAAPKSARFQADEDNRWAWLDGVSLTL
jgi:hypothetical protein